MTDHPITPPPELVEQWKAELPTGVFDGYKFPQREQALCIHAARWGADRELEACCEWLVGDCVSVTASRLRAARRPQPPSLKQQALLAIDVAIADGRLSPDVSNVVRRALEQLDD